MAEPVPDHQLQPCCGKQIERGRGLEFVARQELAAYRALVWPRERPVVLGVRELQGTLRPKRVPALLIAGFSRSLKEPSAVRVVRWRLSSGEG